MEWIDQTELLLSNGMLDALDRSQAIIQFRSDGTIVKANDNFLQTTGYRLDEIVGKHHSIFMHEQDKNSAEYKQFWKEMADGQFNSGQYRRINKQGEEIWLQASYNPIVNTAGKVMGVVKYASDITEQSLRNADYAGQIEAIHKAQAVIEFNLDGTIRTANDNYLKTVGYSLADIKGRHHRMFVEHDYGNSEEYRQFWSRLEMDSILEGRRELQTMARSGSSFVQPHYGFQWQTFKVVKYATDITDRKEAINAVRETMTALSEGDLTVNIDRKFEGEFQILTEH